MDLNKSERRAERQADKRAETLAAMNPLRRTGIKMANKILGRLGMNPEQYFDVFGHGGRIS
jgi:hypothetical protein